MCTALTYQGQHFYFGRNLDLEYGYRETITVVPRNYPFRFRHVPGLDHHHAFIGMAYVQDGYPLHYEATNETGLSMVGLNFPGSARYFPPAPGKDNVSTFELIPWVLGRCATLQEVRPLLERLNITDDSFSDALPHATLHWLIADKTGAVVVESTAQGLAVYDDPVGVLTNEPPFPFHLDNLANYMALSAKPPKNQFCQSLDLKPYSRGMGAFGLPGDLSSASRFVRAAFTRSNTSAPREVTAEVVQFFHLLGSVSMCRGAVDMGDGKYEITRYSSCCDTDTGTYYYTSYENSAITAVELRHEDLDGSALVSYPMLDRPEIHLQN